MARLASDKQLDLIRRIFNELASNPTPEVEAILAAHEVALTDVMGGERITGLTASKTIDALFAAQRVAPRAPLAPERAELIGRMAGLNSDFARSLVNQFNTKGSLSDRQWDAAFKSFGSAVETTQGEPEPQVDVPEGVHITVDVFDPDMVPTVWKVKTSQRSGRLYAVKFHPELSSDRWEYVKGGLNNLSADTVATAELAAKFGHLYGMCCFCGRDLTDDRSIAVGYGPTCAEHHGLPWGDVDQAPAVASIASNADLMAERPELFEVVGEGSFDPFTGVLDIAPLQRADGFVTCPVCGDWGTPAWFPGHHDLHHGITPEEDADDEVVSILTGDPIGVINGTEKAYTLTVTEDQWEIIHSTLLAGMSAKVEAELAARLHTQFTNQKEA